MIASNLNQVLLLTLVLTPVLVSSIYNPRRRLGHVYKKSPAARANIVTLTVFMDWTCDDSKAAYPTLLEVGDKLAGKNFELVMESFSLPFHRNSHTINEVVHVIEEFSGTGAVFSFLTEIYNKQDLVTTDATRNKTDFQVLEIIIPIATKTSGIPDAKLRQELEKRSIDLAARLDFQYGCTRAVHGTPTFMLNDILVDATPTWTVDQWMKTIAPLL